MNRSISSFLGEQLLWRGSLSRCSANSRNESLDSLTWSRVTNHQPVIDLNCAKDQALNLEHCATLVYSIILSFVDAPKDYLYKIRTNRFIQGYPVRGIDRGLRICWENDSVRPASLANSILGTHTLYCRFFLMFAGDMGAGSLILYLLDQDRQGPIEISRGTFMAIAGDEVHIVSSGSIPWDAVTSWLMTVVQQKTIHTPKQWSPKKGIPVVFQSTRSHQAKPWDDHVSPTLREVR